MCVGVCMWLHELVRLFWRLCLSVYVCVFVYVCACVCVYVSACVCVSVYICVRM